jgi:predicted ArsR family transcriptional regulator
MRFDDIKAVLQKKGPLTARQIGRELGMSCNAVTYHISRSRDMKEEIFRIHSYDMSSPTRKERRYEIGSEPDAEFPHGHRAPSVLAKIKNPAKTREQIAEMEHQAKLRALAKKIKPFRDPFIAQFFGAAP